jgi:DNA (cytosine-5)-methyltransferase 1
MKVIGLFSGIGGFELAFQREGFEVVSVCEIDPYCQKVLKAHFPKAKLNPDIRSCSLGDFLARTYPSPDGKSASPESEAGSGLSSQRAIEKIRPDFIVIENVGHTWRRWVPTCA